MRVLSRTTVATGSAAIMITAFLTPAATRLAAGDPRTVEVVVAGPGYGPDVEYGGPGDDTTVTCER